MTVRYSMSFTLDTSAVAALSAPGGVTGEAMQRAADRAARRLAANIVDEGLIDTGAMLGGVQTQVVESGEAGVVVEVGTPVPYGIFHRRPFTDTLNAIRASDTNP